MLKKLMKYDLKYAFKVVMIFCVLAVIFGVLTRVFLGVENSLAMTVLGQISQGIMISMLFNIVINNVIRMWVGFKTHFFGDESYLTHTLPVEKHTHYLSKILATIVSLFVSFLVVCLVLGIAYYSKENLQMIKALLSPLAEVYDSTIVGILASLMLMLFLEFLNVLQCGFTGIILGYRKSTAKIGYSVLFGLVAFWLSQMIVLCVFFGVALFNADYMNLFVTTEAMSVEDIKGMIGVGVACYAFVSLLFCFVNIRLFKQGVDVD